MINQEVWRLGEALVASLRNVCNSPDVVELAWNLDCSDDDTARDHLEAVVHDGLKARALLDGVDPRSVAPPDPRGLNGGVVGYGELLPLLEEFRGRLPPTDPGHPILGRLRRLDHMIHHVGHLIRYYKSLHE